MRTIRDVLLGRHGKEADKSSQENHPKAIEPLAVVLPPAAVLKRGIVWMHGLTAAGLSSPMQHARENF
jgi:hypothetical protein